MSRGRGAHYVPRVKDSSKREVAFSLVRLCIGWVHRCAYTKSTLIIIDPSDVQK